MDKKLRVLFCFPPGETAEDTKERVQALLEQMKQSLLDNVESFEVIHTMEEYKALPEEKRSSYDVNVGQMGGCGLDMITDQFETNSNLKWVHSLSAGIDALMANKAFAKSDIILTNAKGAYSENLGEFIACGILFHSKGIRNFLQKQTEKEWHPEPIEVVKQKHLVIVGYGDIGAACAKVAKFGFGMKVTGIKRDPAKVSQEHKSYCDAVVGNELYEAVIKEADYVVGVLPGVAGVTDDFFNEESTFSKMKSTAVFMNIGRGSTVNEDDLINALKNCKIAGAVLDVFKVEPLPKSSELWSLPNVLIYPHCGAWDEASTIHPKMDAFTKNLELFKRGAFAEMVNLCDKELGY